MIKQLPKIYSIYDRLDTHGLETPNVGENLMDEILDQLPKKYWSNPWIKFLDPCANRGVFLWAIFSRLDDGLKNVIPDNSKRRKHIVEKQLWGMERSESSYDTACATFARSGYPLKNLYNGDFSRGMPKEIRKMKFDVIVGNPPYQESDGGHGASAKGIYDKFVNLAKDLEPEYISFIIPARWHVGGKGMRNFRKTMLNDNQISKMTVYPDSKECFPDNDIEGGICHFLWDKNKTDESSEVSISFKGKKVTSSRKLNEHGDEIFISHPVEVSILNKVLLREKDFLNNKVSSFKPFGLRTFFKSSQETPTKERPIKFYQNKSIGYVAKNELLQNLEWVDDWKVIIPKARGNQKGKLEQLILGYPIVAGPNSACSETYIVVGRFDNQDEAENCMKYIQTKFFRFMVSIIKKTQDAPKKVYRFVPDLETTKVWTDKELYSRYDLTEEEVSFIEKRIKKID